jgi:IS30 family transposase
MVERVVWGLTAKQKAELWERWRAGESVNEIGRTLGKHASSVFDVLQRQGGIYRAPCSRSARCLTLGEREEISRGIAAAYSVREMARQLGRAPSTVSREITRNGGRAGYRAAQADQAAWKRAQRPKRCKLARHPRLRRIVAGKLRLQWSPEQIAGWLKRHYPEDESLHVSHETIYRSLFVQSRGVLKKALMKQLRSRRQMRRGKTATLKGQRRDHPANGVSIRERPPEAEDRAVPGHWEGDLIAGSHNSHVATLVERHSRFVLLAKLDGRDTQTVVAALIKQMKRLPGALRKTLTWDRGAEMAQHRKITIATDLELYFCDPYSPWQRGTNENTNRLLRQYLPKGTDLSVHSQKQLDKIAERLNQRPRKTLDYQTPAEKLQDTVASIS